MNVRSINGAAQVICDAMALDRVPATIARALDASGWLNTTEAAAELVRLRLLQNAQPAELSEAQVDALADAGNEALNDHYHEELCHCSSWPESCVSSGSYFAGSWDTAAFSIGMAAVIGAWEAMRNPSEAAELSRLRARVAELEAERHETNAALSDAAEALRVGRDRIAGLEAERRTVAAARDAQVIAWLGKKAREYRSTRGREHALQAEVLERMADKVRRGAIRPDVPREDPHDSPLHRKYKTPRDIEFPQQEAPRV